MDSAQTQEPATLPGERLANDYRSSAISFGLFSLVFVVLLVAVTAGPLKIQYSGHLPWPVVQWALFSPVGAVTLVIIAAGLAALLLARLRFRLRVGNLLARAQDMTGAEPAEWASAAMAEVRAIRAMGWLGQRGRTRSVSIVLLLISSVLILAAIGSFGGVIFYTHDTLDALNCSAAGCPPFFPVIAIGLASLNMSTVLGELGLYLWLRRFEDANGISLRWYPTPKRLVAGYIRLPGTTAERASAALAQVMTRGYTPRARRIFIFAQIILWVVLMIDIWFLLAMWLLGYWQPT
jgi:hypothetical protein